MTREDYARALGAAARPLAPVVPELGRPALLSEEVGLLDQVADLWARRAAPADPITARVAMELIAHEAIVQEAYRDSKGIWTWGVGVTNASGHIVYPRYKDNPQTLSHCLAVYVWLLRERYLPAVLKAFAGRALSEAQFAAALSFHYNTGAILTASWPKLWLAGEVAKARTSIMEWRKPPEIVGRRTKERDLFFEGKWSSDGTALVLSVRKPSYQPDFRNGRRVDITADLAAALAQGGDA